MSVLWKAKGKVPVVHTAFVYYHLEVWQRMGGDWYLNIAEDTGIYADNGATKLEASSEEDAKKEAESIIRKKLTEKMETIQIFLDVLGDNND